LKLSIYRHEDEGDELKVEQMKREHKEDEGMLLSYWKGKRDLTTRSQFLVLLH
jgi:hypothetical protein